MKKIIREGKDLWITELDGVEEKLAPGNYLLKHHEKRGYYISEKEDFVLPSKMYGDSTVIDRWLKSYEKNTMKNLGILLSGCRGSGKTILAQEFCIRTGKPVIMITQPFSGPDFVDYITQPMFDESIIFIDELEKIYQSSRMTYDEYGEPCGNGKDAQKDLLGIMDGNYPTKLIFLFTVNVASDLNEYLINRLSRIKYRKHFSGLSKEVISEIIEDLLDNKDYKNELIDLFKKIGICTMDLLIPIIQECNLHKESPSECAKHLNLQCEKRYYEIIEIFKGAEKKCDPAFFSLDQKDQLYINRSWLNSFEDKKQYEKERSGCTVNFFQDSVKIISEEEVRITTLNEYEFICRVKDNVSLIF